ncbi:hypothetical protein [Metalysinibacillus jejuensis]|uniref:hypothetical protein n=1 Tax=Metalysinibacillus jejuensis TaxID=914327 RepID=UPI000D3D6EB5|nr:hypothetical protein [Metalysinibacillus jejuensis]
MSMINLGDVVATTVLLLPLFVIVILFILTIRFIKRAEQRNNKKLHYEHQASVLLTEDLKDINERLDKIQRLLRV